MDPIPTTFDDDNQTTDHRPVQAEIVIPGE